MLVVSDWQGREFYLLQFYPGVWQDLEWTAEDPSRLEEVGVELCRRTVTPKTVLGKKMRVPVQVTVPPDTMEGDIMQALNKKPDLEVWEIQVPKNRGTW